MDGKKISERLRQAFRDSGLTLWEVADRAELQAADVARALGRHAVLPPPDLIEAVGNALGLELVFVERTVAHAVSEPRTVVDEAVGRVAPERMSYPGESAIKVLALDLEATLISDAVTATARPGLFNFLQVAHGLFERVVLFTSISEQRVREIALALLQEGYVPAWFVAVEYVRWNGLTKDLNFINFITAEEALLVDDTAQAVHPGQERQWVRIGGYVPPFEVHDDELPRVLEELVDRVVRRTSLGGARP